MKMLTPAELSDRAVRLLDQRKLPLVEVWLECESPEATAAAITDMVVRGAPAIGITAAFGLALGASKAVEMAPELFDRRMEELFQMMTDARPTAVNLRWATERMRSVTKQARAEGLANGAIAEKLEAEARQIHAEDLASCQAIGRHGAPLVPDEATVLTHCNAGALATAGYGTALGVVRGAVEAGKKVRVLADETRPFLQGARLTAWELMRDGIETVLITDNMAGSVMQSGDVDLVVVGSDRIAANGDVANKIGTYSLAILAKEHGIPFYVAAPLSTIDFDCPDGAGIPIEERDPREVTEFFGMRIAPPDTKALNRAFDVTPARYVKAIITEQGIAEPPFEDSLAAQRRQAG
jgi:methylthioribose-1-phosphate isomerase